MILMRAFDVDYLNQLPYGTTARSRRNRLLTALGVLALFAISALTGWQLGRLATSVKPAPVAFIMSCYAAPAAMHPDHARPARYAPDSPAFHCLGETSK
jgi:cytochrome oxidase assembly protein ShyY1